MTHLLITLATLAGNITDSGIWEDRIPYPECMANVEVRLVNPDAGMTTGANELVIITDDLITEEEFQKLAASLDGVIVFRLQTVPIYQVVFPCVYSEEELIEKQEILESTPGIEFADENYYGGISIQ